MVNDPLYNHPVFGPEKGKLGRIGKTDEQLIKDLINIHNAENWLGGGPLEAAEDGVGAGPAIGAPPPPPIAVGKKRMIEMEHFAAIGVHRTVHTRYMHDGNARKSW